MDSSSASPAVSPLFFAEMGAMASRVGEGSKKRRKNGMEGGKGYKISNVIFPTTRLRTLQQNSKRFLNRCAAPGKNKGQHEGMLEAKRKKARRTEDRCPLVDPSFQALSPTTPRQGNDEELHRKMRKHDTLGPPCISASFSFSQPSSPAPSPSRTPTYSSKPNLSSGWCLAHARRPDPGRPAGRSDGRRGSGPP